MINTRDCNLEQHYNYVERVSLFSAYTKKIQSVLFDGIKKGVFDRAKFDSHPELLLARVLEYDTEEQNWLRPAPQEFNITYNRGHSYEPDFMVETETTIYLVEVKGEDKLNDPDVIAKKSVASSIVRWPPAGAMRMAISSGDICSFRPSRLCRTPRLCN